MSDNTDFGFARLVPGFDFLQNLAKGAAQGLPQMPNLSNWVAPTLDVEELDKRINDLKAVHFWLDQNGKALAATIQALEVQKMTLATLQGMNFSMGDLARALKVSPAEAGAARPGPAGAGAQAAPKATAKKAAQAKAAQRKAGSGPAPIDPLQWWGALTQQFQQIAADALKDVAEQTAADGARKAGTAAGASAAPARRRARPRRPPARRRASHTARRTRTRAAT